MHEPPLTDRELKVLRGMLDEYQYSRSRRHVFAELWDDARGFAKFIAATSIVVLNIVTVVLLLSGTRP